MNDQEIVINEKFSLTTVNQGWFKFLALISFLCALFVNASLIWLLVCRSQRLQKTDTELKEHEAVNYHFKEAKQFDLGQRLKYLFFGNMDVISPSASPLLKPKQTVRISAKTEKSKADHVQTVNEKSPKKLTKKPAKK